MRSASAAALAATLLGACVSALPGGTLGGSTAGSGGSGNRGGAGGIAGAPSAAGTGGLIGPDASAGGAGGAAPAPYLFVTNIAGVNVPRTLVADSRYVYWLDTVQGGVWRAPFMGGPAVMLWPGLTQGYDWLAVDSESVYWSVGAGLIVKTPIEGGAETTVVPFTDSRRSILQFAVNQDAVFWIESVSDGGAQSVMKVGKDGGTPTLLAASQGPTAIAVDEQNVYWAEAPWASVCPTLDCASIKRIAASGGQAVVLAPAGGVATRLALDATHVYWLGDARTVNRVSKDGGAAESVRGAADATTFAVDASGVYWGDWNGSVWVAAPGAANPRILAQSWSVQAMALGEHDVYWIDQRSIYRMPK